MAWNTFPVVVLRGHDTVDDPEADGYTEAIYQVREVMPVRVPVGDSRTFVGDITFAARLRVRHFKVRPSPVSTLAQIVTAEVQDWGIYEQVDYVLTRQFVYFYRYYLNGANHGLGPAPRAARHDAATNGTNALWNLTSDTPAGVLPVAVELPDAIAPQLISGGRYEWDHTLVSRVPMSRS